MTQKQNLKVNRKTFNRKTLAQSIEKSVSDFNKNNRHILLVLCLLTDWFCTQEEIYSLGGV